MGENNMTNRLTTDDSLNVLCLAKGDERWIVLFSEAERDNVVIALRNWCDDISLLFTPYDAGCIMRRMHEEMECEGR
jgi:hypothetical protein